MRSYGQEYANVHRGVHYLSQVATDRMEAGREKVRAFLNAASTDEIVFVRGATEGINLVAASWGRNFLKPGDEVILTVMEHHSNIVPWQLLCERTGATLKWFGITDDGRLDLSRIDEVITPRTKIVSFVHVSNILGTLNDPAPIVRRAHDVGALVHVDACAGPPDPGSQVRGGSPRPQGVAVADLVLVAGARDDPAGEQSGFESGEDLLAPLVGLASGVPTAAHVCSTGKRVCSVDKSCMIRHADGTVECKMRRHKAGSHARTCKAFSNCSHHDGPVLPVVQNLERPFITARVSFFSPGASRAEELTATAEYESLANCPPHRPPVSL